MTVAVLPCVLPPALVVAFERRRPPRPAREAAERELTGARAA